MSKYLGDFKKNAVVDFTFTTYRPSTGATYTLAGTPKVVVYKNGSSTPSSEYTPSVDYNSKTGLNRVEIDTSAAFFIDPGQYEVVISAGTVDSVSVANACVGRFTIGLNADAVWDEAYSGHTASGSFGKLMDILRKANLVTEGSVSALGTTMRCSITGDASGKADNFWRGQTILFTGGGANTLTGQSSVIAASTSSSITFDSPVSANVPSGAEFVILPVHVHPTDEIGEAFLSARLKSIGQIGIVSATTINADPVISGVNSYVLNDTVTFLGSAPTNFVAGTKYHVISADLSPTTFRLSASQGGTVITPGSSGTYVVIPYDMRTVRAAMQYLRNKVEIVSSTLNVYTEDDTAKAWTAAVATSGSTTPITSSDPA